MQFLYIYKLGFNLQAMQMVSRSLSRDFLRNCRNKVTSKSHSIKYSYLESFRAINRQSPEILQFSSEK